MSFKNERRKIYDKMLHCMSPKQYSTIKQSLSFGGLKLFFYPINIRRRTTFKAVDIFDHPLYVNNVLFIIFGY